MLSNGSGIMVVEELEHAKARGANIMAEIIGFGMSGDAHHMTAPPVDGAGAARCMKVALKDAGINMRSMRIIRRHAGKGIMAIACERPDEARQRAGILRT